MPDKSGQVFPLPTRRVSILYERDLAHCSLRLTRMSNCQAGWMIWYAHEKGCSRKEINPTLKKSDMHLEILWKEGSKNQLIVKKGFMLCTWIIVLEWGWQFLPGPQGWGSIWMGCRWRRRRDGRRRTAWTGWRWRGGPRSTLPGMRRCDLEQNNHDTLYYIKSYFIIILHYI